MKGEGRSLTPDEKVEYLADLAADYPIVSIEDGMGEDDMDRLEGADRQARRQASSWSATICSSPTRSAWPRASTTASPIRS